MHGEKCPAHMFFSNVPPYYPHSHLLRRYLRCLRGRTEFKARTCYLGFVQLGSVTLNGRPSIYFTFDFLTQPLAYLPPHDINLSSGLQRTQARDRKVNP